MKIFLITELDNIIENITNSISQGVQWGNSVIIALTASLLAISLIRFLYDRTK